MEHVALAALAVAVIVLLVRDASSRRKIAELRRRVAGAEADSRATTELATVGERVTGLVQALKTPLQSVLGNTEVMLAEQPRTEELLDIHDHAARAADIVRNMVAFSETTTLARRWQDLNEVAARAIDAARAPAAAAGHTVQFDPAERLPVVYVDGRQLEKAIAALISCGGHVPGFSGTASIVVSTAFSASQDRLIIDVEFQGATQDAVEETLAGSELDACRHVIRAHGGRVTADSRPAAAAVRIELPAAIVELAESRHSTAETSQESSPSWTRLSTSSTSTASGTSRN